ncbi:hypothetical protein EBBID32_35800 [Sphingobium indicum BiD32]|uniref:Uncharacterized protein n=1 Tax=Sphingobium indicum BiD32 TaxID=1301087 RepID=N1MR70_9SPHN|nr:hypothetical protein EBBID32_35800 [Sphingobium indicum BiD32]
MMRFMGMILSPLCPHPIGCRAWAGLYQWPMGRAIALPDIQRQQESA